MISTHLRHDGYDVEWVPDGERGLDKLRFGRPVGHHWDEPRPWSSRVLPGTTVE